MKNIPADGHCMFRAILSEHHYHNSDQIADDNAVAALRDEVALRLKECKAEIKIQIKSDIKNKNLRGYGELQKKLEAWQDLPEEEIAYLINDTIVEEYIENIRDSNMWGGALELGIISDILKRDIVIHYPISYVQPPYRVTQNYEDNIVNILYNGRDHYGLCEERDRFDDAARYELHYDDSSDDEEPKIDIDKSWIGFNEKRKIDPFLKVLDEAGAERAYKSYLFGLSMLKESSVRKNYAALKRKYLSGNALPEEKVLENWIRKSIYGIIKENLSSFMDNYNFPNEKRLLEQGIIRHLNGKIELLVSQCLEHKHNLIMYMIDKRELNQAISLLFKDFYQAFLEIGQTKVKEIIGKKKIIPSKGFNIDELITNAEVINEIDEQLINDLTEIDQVYEWVENKSFKDARQKPIQLLTLTGLTSTSQAAKEKRDYILKTYNLTDVQKEYIREITSAHTSHDTFKESFISIKRLDKFNSIIEQEKGAGLITDENKVVSLDVFDGSQLEKYKDALEPYTILNIDEFELKVVEGLEGIELNEMFDDFLSALKTRFSRLEEHSIRATLPSSMEMKINSFAEYVAHLRLEARSVKRIIRNQKTPSILGGAKEENHHRTYQFKASIMHKASLTQRVTSKRSDRVSFSMNGGSYSGLNDIINSIKKIELTVKESEEKIYITDQDIAKWIREILNQEKISFITCKNEQILLNHKKCSDLTQFLISFTHLFMGVETMRHPGAFITHQMALDLILMNKITWGDLLTKSLDTAYLPLTIKKIMPVARTISFNYGRKYNYDGEGKFAKPEDPKIPQFIQAEAKLTELWLKSKNVKRATNSKPALNFTESVLKAKWYKGADRKR